MPAGLADAVDVAGEDGHHLARVLRLRVGETVTVADGSGGWRPYRIGGIGGGATGAVVRLDATGGPEREPAPAPRLAVAFALTKGDKPELVVQKLTELGVDRILPVLAERSVARPDAGRAKTARRALAPDRPGSRPPVPPGHPPGDRADLGPLSALAGHPGLVVAERGGEPAAAVGSPPGGEVLVVVGPEGGLTDAEVEALAPWRRLDLGPHILRAETAAARRRHRPRGRTRPRRATPVVTRVDPLGGPGAGFSRPPLLFLCFSDRLGRGPMDTDVQAPHWHNRLKIRQKPANNPPIRPESGQMPRRVDICAFAR